MLCIIDNLIKQWSFVYTQLTNQTVLFQTIQFSIICLHSVKISNSSIWPIYRTLSGATTLGQGRPGSDGNERVLHIPQSFSITGISMRMWNVISLWVSYLSAEMYFTTPTSWAPKLQNWSLIIWCSSVSYPVHLFFLTNRWNHNRCYLFRSG